jgi:tetratricopeptide (TPR) repeat protein
VDDDKFYRLWLAVGNFLGENLVILLNLCCKRFHLVMLMRSNRFWLALGMVVGVGFSSVTGMPAIAASPTSNPATTAPNQPIPPDAQASFAKANQQLEASNLTEALATLDAVVKRYPKLAAAYLERAKLYAMSENWTDRNAVTGMPPIVRDSYILENLNRAIALQPNYVEAYVQRGYLRMESYYDAEKALIDFNRAAQLDPAGKVFADWRYALRAKAQMRVGNWQAAKADFDRAMKANYRGEFDRGVAAVLAGDLAAGIRDFNHVIQMPQDEIWPDQSIVLYWRGMAKALGKDYNGALSDLNQALAAVPPNDDYEKAELLRDRGWIKWLQGKPQDALKDLNQAVEIGKRDGQISSNHGKEVTHYLRAALYTELGDRTRAAAITQDLSAGQLPVLLTQEKHAYRHQVQAKLIAPVLAKPIHPDPAISRLLQAVLHNAMHDRPAALTAYKEAIRLAPNNVAIYAWADQAGIFNGDPGDPAAAVANFTQLIRLQPKQANWYRLRAFYAVAMGDYKMAIANYDWLIQNEPTADAYSDRGRAKLAIGDYQGALSDFNNAIKPTQPISTPVLPNIYLSRAEAYFALQDYQKAAGDLAKVKQSLQPGSSFLGVSMADVNRLSGKLKLAMGDAKGAIADFVKFKTDILSGYYRAENGIGLAKLKLGDKAGAANAFEQALYANAEPDNAEAFYERGVSLRYLGDQASAIRHYKTAADLYQKSGQIAQQKKVLAEMKSL